MKTILQVRIGIRRGKERSARHATLRKNIDVDLPSIPLKSMAVDDGAFGKVRMIVREALINVDNNNQTQLRLDLTDLYARSDSEAEGIVADWVKLGWYRA